MRPHAHFLASVLIGAWPAAALATYHFMEIQQIIGGVKNNTNAQAIQLRMRQAAQEQVHKARIRAWDSQGSNPIVIILFPHDVTNGTKGDAVLITTTDFDALTDTPTQPDFTMTNPIPASYLAAGSLTYEYAVDGTILWRVCWGGSNYTGPTTTSMVNHPGGNSGTPFSGPLPSSGLLALMNTKSVSDTPGTSATDYALTSGAAVFTNNGRQQFTLVDACPNDPNKAAPGGCGCGTPDTDRDGDGRLDCVDPCPDNPADLPADNCDGTAAAPAPAASRGVCGLGGAQTASLTALTLCLVRSRRRGLLS